MLYMVYSVRIIAPHSLVLEVCMYRSQLTLTSLQKCLRAASPSPPSVVQLNREKHPLQRNFNRCGTCGGGGRRSSRSALFMAEEEEEAAEAVAEQAVEEVDPAQDATT